MSKGIKEINKGEPLNDIGWKALAPYDSCAVCAKMASLRAKVYVYEKIIANSNFSPMVQDKPKEEERKEERKVERGARWILRKLENAENEHAIVCSNCMNVLLTLVGYKNKEEARQGAKGSIECGAITPTNYCSCCGARMEVDI